MAWVRTVEPPEAEGYVKTLYEGILKQRGWIPNIVRSTTIRPELTRAWMSVFNFITRVADALGVELNPEYRAAFAKVDDARVGEH